MTDSEAFSDDATSATGGDVGATVDLMRDMAAGLELDRLGLGEAPAHRPPRTQRPQGSPGSLAELCRLGIADGDLCSLLHRVAELASEGIGWADAASVLLGDPSEPEMLASSSSLSQAGDGAQYLAGSGPIFDAYRLGRPVGSRRLLDEERWPVLQRADARHTPNGCLALPLVLDDTTIGIVALYHRHPGPPGDEGLGAVAEQALPYTARAQTLIRDGRLVEELLVLRDQLQQALTSRAVIDQAKGMIMMARRCGPDEAFETLVRQSNNRNCKLRDLARQIIDQAARG
jgi:GAF domain-containing protein